MSNGQNNVAYGFSQPLITVFPPPILSRRNPSTSDKAPIGTVWINEALDVAWIETSIVNNQAHWEVLSGGSNTFVTNAGIAIPVAGILNIFGGTGIATSGLGNTVTISTAATVPSVFHTDAGDAIPAANALNVFGGTAGRDINTSGSGSTIHIDLKNAITLGDLAVLGAGVAALTATTGDVHIVAGNLTLPDTNTAGSQGEIIFGASTKIFNYPTGSANFFAGALVANTTLTGIDNNAIGGGVFSALTSGSSNAGFGHISLFSLTTGSNNSGFGYNSLHTITTGSNNSALGKDAGSALTVADSNNIMIGNIGVAGDSGRIRIGTNGTHTTTFIAGIDGVNVGSVAKVVTEASDQLGTAILTAGTNISITGGANTITIAGTGAAGFSWSVITVNQTAVVNQGYITNKATTLVLLLPATAAIGDMIRVTGIQTAASWQITQNANQQIFFGTGSTTIGVGGSITATAIHDSIEMVCVVAGASTNWNIISAIGNLTII